MDDSEEFGAVVNNIKTSFSSTCIFLDSTVIKTS